MDWLLFQITFMRKNMESQTTKTYTFLFGRIALIDYIRKRRGVARGVSEADPRIGGQPEKKLQRSARATTAPDGPGKRRRKTARKEPYCT